MKFISLPLKKAEPTDWIHPLKTYLAQIYGSYSDFEDSVHLFDKLRIDIIHSNKDNIAKELYYHYYGQLELLELRVPLPMLGVKFTWYDAFKPSEKTTQHSAAFEKASILFNLGSLLSILGVQAAAEDDLKESYSDFQKAAGVYQFIQENFMHAPSDDLQVDTVKAFYKLMLAQAQEAFLLKYLASGVTLKMSLCAKLAQATSNLYATSHDLTSSIDYIPAEQDYYCKLKQMYYQSMAHYYNSKGYVEKGEYGVGIANLKLAQTDMDGYKRYNPSYDHSIVESMKDHLDTVEMELKQLDKDNDFIYHQNVPKAVGLSPIKPLESSKAIPLNEQQIDSMVGHDLFEKIIPMSVHEKSSLYSEEKAQIVRDEEDRCSTASEVFNSTLEFLKLPQSLTELKQLCEPLEEVDQRASDEIDPRVLAISAEVSSTNVDLSAAQRVRRDIQNTLQRCDQLLLDDTNRYEKNRALHGAQWTQELYPSELIQIKEDLGKARKSLLDAAESDSKIQQLYESNRADIDVLKFGPSDPRFAKSFLEETKDTGSTLAAQVSLLDIDDTPRSVADIPEIKAKLNTIDSKLQELRRLQKERSNTLMDLRQAIRDDDISNVLVLNKDKENMDDLFNQELQKFKPYQERIAATTDKQSSLINDMKQSMAEVLDDTSVKACMKKREKDKGSRQTKTSHYLDAYESWKAYKSGCEQAPLFYKQLLQFSTNLKYKIEKFAGERANEGNRMLQSIQARGSTEQDLLRQRMNQSQGYPPPPAYTESYPSGYQRPGPSAPSAPSTSLPYMPPKPPLPSKPTNQQSGDFYSTPSAYDPSLYSKFGNRNWNQ
ncbi:hypothetical protein FOA43_002146 [Brettanomyces nanus]|uniref:BRO domain-containing protein 1 n=1 Tax=Eeniella nana TaxID=13502 RepID=A0A875RPA8_EENNA|nr:uncharacterized protein FOA43_002146 [Brettanomyces nanus]QPG74810.1 hypothetical protein FOA43_002146 [Brettanomyces nanus]